MTSEPRQKRGRPLKTARILGGHFDSVLIATMALASSGLLSAAPTTPGQLPPGRLVLAHANVIDGRGAEPRRDVSVVIEGGKIASILDASRPHPPGASVIDVGGHWVMPGLVDAHVHFADVAAARTALSTGATTVRTMHVERFLDIQIREAHRLGDPSLPDVVAAGYQIRPDMFPSFFEAFPALADMQARVTGVDRVRRVVRALASRRVDHIKFLATERAGTPETDPRTRTFSDEEVTALVDEARRLGLPASAHAHGDEGARAAVLAGVRTIEHGTWISDATFQLMLARRTCYVPTFTGGSQPPARPQDREHPVLAERRRVAIPLRNRLVARAEAAGLPLAAGTDLRYTTRDLSMADEALHLHRAGLATMRVLQVMTVGSATCLGIQERTGAVAPGLEADLLVLERSPVESLDALKDITLIVNDGRIAFDVRRASPP